MKLSITVDLDDTAMTQLLDQVVRRALSGATSSDVATYVTIAEVRRRLRLAPSTVAQLAREGKLEAIHVGRAVRISEASLTAFIQRSHAGAAIEEDGGEEDGAEEARGPISLAARSKTSRRYSYPTRKRKAAAR